MNEETRKALDWLLNRWPNENDTLRSYPINMVVFIASMCAEYRAKEGEGHEQSRRHHDYGI